MRSWVFRNRLRLEALLGRRPTAATRTAPAPREVVLVPARSRALPGR